MRKFTQSIIKRFERTRKLVRCLGSFRQWNDPVRYGDIFDRGLEICMQIYRQLVVLYDAEIENRLSLDSIAALYEFCCNICKDSGQ